MKRTRIYTQEEVLEALTLIGLNGGSVPLTAMQTAIPERTLYRWKKEQNTGNANFWQKKNPAPLPTADPIKLPALSAETLENPYGIIRERLLAHILHLTENLTHHPYELQAVAMAVTRMIDRLIKLEALDDRYQPEQVIRVEYKDPDGSIHNTPMWRRDEETPVTMSGADRARLTYLDDEFNAPRTTPYVDPRQERRQGLLLDE
ncbi:MAG: hypothetical protein RLP44_08865 [Aggregatilineales bacterium]